MNEELESNLSREIQAFSELESTGNTQTITEAYNRILAIVQAMMLSSDNADAHVRAWSLLNDDVYKNLLEVQEGKTDALQELKIKIAYLGELLLAPDGPKGTARISLK